jgi:hypothetical protein
MPRCPVVTRKDSTYELPAFSSWFEQGNNTGPMTNMPPQEYTDLITNVSLRSQIWD